MMFVLVDCNNFYVSCERVFNPKLKNRPVIVLSNNDGCIVSRSDEFKKLGVSVGAPFFKVKEQILKLNTAVFSSNYTLYRNMSDRVMQSLSFFCDDLEIYSIDEAFLKIPDLSPEELTQFGQEIKETVEKWTGIPVSVGIAKTKTLAKAANEIAKINFRKGAGDLKGVLYLDLNDSDKYLEKLEISEVWGVGRKYTKKLQAEGIYFAKDFKDKSLDWIEKKMTIVGRKTAQELNGIVCFDLENNPEPKKGILSSRSFGKKVTDIKDLSQAVAYHAGIVGEKLRKQKSVAGRISVFVISNRFLDNFYYNSQAINLPISSNDTVELTKKALEGLENIFKKGISYKKVGTMATELTSEDEIQLSLYEDCDDRREAVNKT